MILTELNILISNKIRHSKYLQYFRNQNETSYANQNLWRQIPENDTVLEL